MYTIAKTAEAINLRETVHTPELWGLYLTLVSALGAFSSCWVASSSFNRLQGA